MNDVFVSGFKVATLFLKHFTRDSNVLCDISLVTRRFAVLSGLRVNMAKKANWSEIMG